MTSLRTFAWEANYAYALADFFLNSRGNLSRFLEAKSKSFCHPLYVSRNATTRVFPIHFCILSVTEGQIYRQSTTGSTQSAC